MSSTTRTMSMPLRSTATVGRPYSPYRALTVRVCGLTRLLAVPRDAGTSAHRLGSPTLPEFMCVEPTAVWMNTSANSSCKLRLGTETLLDYNDAARRPRHVLPPDGNNGRFPLWWRQQRVCNLVQCAPAVRSIYSLPHNYPGILRLQKYPSRVATKCRGHCAIFWMASFPAKSHLCLSGSALWPY